MFDANARHIPIGVTYFAKVEAVDAKLASFGIISGDVILCRNVDKTNKYRPVVEIWTQQDKHLGSYMYQHEGSGLGAWVLYEGNPDGSSFICDESRQKALEFLGGAWDTAWKYPYNDCEIV